MKLLIFSSLITSFLYFNFNDTEEQRSEVDNTEDPKHFELDSALVMIEASAFIEAGLTGKNVKIGILDVGFSDADKQPYLNDIFKENAIRANRDFVDITHKDFYTGITNMDIHGSMVWKYIGGYDAQENKLYGLANNAEFYLARTDHGEKEYTLEQSYFRSALKWLDSMEVRLVHSSLGYSYGFDNPEENYTPSDMDGQSALITKTVKEFAQNEDMIMITSAGNEGDNPWRVVSAPADAEDILTVGALDKLKVKKGFSSEGTDFVPYLKPNVSCFNSVGGTSLTAPVVTGIIACMLEKDPSLTKDNIHSIIEKSGHLYPYGNNYVGYGIPNCRRILKLMDKEDYDFKRTEVLMDASQVVQLPVSEYGTQAIVFHKKDKWICLRQERVQSQEDYVIIQRPKSIERTKLVVEDKVKGVYHLDQKPEEVNRSTVVFADKVVEIHWK